MKEVDSELYLQKHHEWLIRQIDNLRKEISACSQELNKKINDLTTLRIVLQDYARNAPR